MTRVYINNRNRFTPVRAMVAWLGRIKDVQITVVDNDSTYPPLLSWYQSKPCGVVRLADNHGIRAPWDLGIVRPTDEYYVVTDSDLDLSFCPRDLLDVLREGLDRYPAYGKCGLSLEIEGLPDENPWKEQIIKDQMQFWMEPKDSMYIKADIDTTFAMYREPQWGGYGALRTNRPYTCKHLPWYVVEPDAEERYYLQHATAGGICWTAKARDHWKLQGTRHA